MNRVLVHRLGSIGDTVVAMPAFHLIRQRFPNHRITVLTNATEAGPTASIAAVLPPDLYDDVLHYRLHIRSVSELRALRALIEERRYDIAISLVEARGYWKSVRDDLFFRACRIPDIRGIPFRADHLTRRREPGSTLYRHEARRLLDRLHWLGAVDLDDERWWDLRLSPAERSQAEGLLKGVPAPIVAFSIGTKWEVNDWSQPNWRSLISRLSAARSAQYSLVAVGAEPDRARSQELLDLWDGTTANLCGRANPRVSASILQHATLYLGHDSGPLHLAAAVGTPSVAVYSGRNPPGVWFPRGANHTVFYHHTPCFDCGLATCITFQKKCILSIAVDSVYEAVMIRLDGRTLT